MLRIFSLKMYHDCQYILINMLNLAKQVSFTIDAWTIYNQIPILGMAINWIDEEWTICKHVLAVEELNRPYTWDNVAHICSSYSRTSTLWAR